MRPLVKDMKAKEIIVKALHENFSEFTEDQADAVLEAIKQEGFVLAQEGFVSKLKTTMENHYDRLNNVLHEEGYNDKIFGQLMGLDFVEEVIDEMIESQEQKG